MVMVVLPTAVQLYPNLSCPSSPVVTEREKRRQTDCAVCDRVTGEVSTGQKGPLMMITAEFCDRFFLNI